MEYDYTGVMKEFSEDAEGNTIFNLVPAPVLNSCTKTSNDPITSFAGCGESFLNGPGNHCPDLEMTEKRTRAASVESDKAGENEVSMEMMKYHVTVQPG